MTAALNAGSPEEEANSAPGDIDIVLNRIIGYAKNGANVTRALIDKPGFIRDLITLIHRCRKSDRLHESGLRAVNMIYSFDWPDVRISLLCNGLQTEALDVLRAHDSSSIGEVEMVGIYILN
jgi:hypothetical protein